MPTILRPSRALFRFSGADAQRLLNDVVTGTIEAAPAIGRWWGLLSPQGKLQAEGLCGWADGAFYLDVHESVADAFLRRMRMYKLRAQLEIEDLRVSHAVGWSSEPPTGGLAHEDARGLGYRHVLERGETELTGDERKFETARIALGLAELGSDFAPDTTFPHDIAMDLLGGVDFKKGCYVGQEVVSRMRHRGTARRRPAIVEGSALADRAAIMAGGRECGDVGRVVDGKAVAIVRLDRIADPEATSVAGQPARLTVPAWATYRFGESAAAD